MKALRKPHLLILISLAVFSISCSQQTQRARVAIHFDSSIFSGKVSQLSSADGVNNNGPNWGLQDPETLADIQCLGVFVHANEQGMRESSCSNELGEKMMSFGPKAGFFARGETGEIFVPAGAKRTFYLYGMASADGSCEKGFSNNEDLNFANHSHPFFLGKSTVDLSGGDNKVRIVVSENFTDENKLNTCDFIKPDEDDINFTPLTLGHFDSQRSIWLNNNAIPRTVELHYVEDEIDKVECSSTGVANLSEATCTTPTTFVWDPTNKDDEHHVRITYKDGSTDLKNFTPTATDLHGPLEFVACTYQYSAPGQISTIFGTKISDGSTNNTFASALANANQVICIANGVTFTESAAASLDIANDNTVIISPQSDPINRPTLNHTSLGNSTITSSGSVQGTKIIGIKIMNASTSGTNAAIDLSSGVNDIQIQDVDITTTNTAFGIQMSLAGATTPVEMHASTMTCTGTCLNVGSSSQLEVYNSTIYSNAVNIQAHNGGQVTVVDSTIENNGSLSWHYLIFNNGSGGVTYNISNTKFIDHFGNGIKLDGNPGNVNTSFENNDFYKPNNANTVNTHDDPYIKVTPGSNVVTINSSGGNRFCHEDGSAAAIANPPIQSGYTGTYISNLSQQINNGQPEECIP